ncbi:MAG: bifunctional pyr operon transcriptional regulator/uracil phosphoribosyltransferase PyrR [Actinomycetota bacterium]|nr:bifunctional pyr operon transcriptional regulator/uracil phosphoribosyltransferase PyrR [Actinomycetota bacterium]
MPGSRVVLDGEEMRRTLTRIAHEIVENGGEPEQLALVGIHRRGAVLAARLRDLLAELHDIAVPLGDLDIAFYRDDVTLRGGTPVVHATHLDFDVDGRTIVIVDDVMFTGRTVRAAIEALFDYGRPARVQLAVLADRGHRELPLRPDYVGKNLPTARGERVFVQVTEIDGEDSVTIAEQPLDAELPAQPTVPLS